MQKNLSSIIRVATGNFIKELRTEAGISQEICGIAIGLSQSQFSKIERGEQPLTIEDAAKLLKLLIAANS